MAINRSLHCNFWMREGPAVHPEVHGWDCQGVQVCGKGVERRGADWVLHFLFTPPCCQSIFGGLRQQRLGASLPPSLVLDPPPSLVAFSLSQTPVMYELRQQWLEELYR